MFNSFRRLLKRSKDREIPQTGGNDKFIDANSNGNLDRNESSSYLDLKLLNRPRPGLAAEISRLRRQHRELQRRFKQLPHGQPHVRRTKLTAALGKMAAVSRSAVQPGRNLGRPLTSIDPSWLAARSAQRIKATKIPSYRTSLNVKMVQKSASLEAETSLDNWHAHQDTNIPAAALALPAGDQTKEKAMSAPFKQAASAHRMRRLREWSQTHGQDVAEGGEQDFAEAALAKIQQESTSAPRSDTASTVPPKAAASLKDKAWSIMAGLHLETLDKKRGVSVMDITATPGAGTNTAAATGGVPIDAAGDRRKTEPLNNSPSVGTKWQRSSLEGRPRTKMGIEK